jgi:proline racemase
MSDNDKIIDKTLLDRIFNQIDTNTQNIFELTRISGEHSSTIEILKKISIGIFLFVMVSSLTLFFTFTDNGIKKYFEKKEVIQEKINEQLSINENQKNEFNSISKVSF